MNARVDRWMFEAFALSPRSLGVARIIIGAYLVLYRPPDLRWINSFPNSFFRPPPGPFRLIDGIPSSGVITTVSVGLSIATVALLVGYHTRLASCATGLLLFMMDGLSYSFGHVHHSGTLLAALLVIMAASNWGGSYSVDALRRRSGPEPVAEAWPLALGALLISFLMLTAALPKLASGWLDPSVLAVRAHVVHRHFASAGEGLLGALALESRSAFIWKPFDYLTLLLEAGFILAVVSPRATRLFCAAAVVFHLGVFIGLNIDFTGNVVAYAVFFEWSTVVDYVHRAPRATALAKNVRRRLARNRAPIGLAVLMAGVALYLLTMRFGVPIRYLARRITTNSSKAATLLLFALAIPIAFAYIGIQITHASRYMTRHRASRPTESAQD
jgi:uncharacterized membrane protein YphA (DoxX/SURF4 family)